MKYLPSNLPVQFMLHVFLFLVLGACQSAGPGDQESTGTVAEGRQLNAQETVSSESYSSGAGKQQSGVSSAVTKRALLDSWRAGNTRRSIEKFVKDSVTEGNSRYVAVEDRVAVFDLDGTLWVEYPQYPLMDFVINQLQRQLDKDPSLRGEQPWKAVWEQDANYFQRMNSAAMYRTFLKTHAGKSQRLYSNDVKRFISNYQHLRFSKPYTELSYRPMQELIAYLQAYDYQVYIVAGSETPFIRVIAEAVFAVPAENVIGSNVLMDWQADRNRLVRQDAFMKPINDQRGKPVNIERHIGRRPVIAVGNADGDIAMLQYTTRRKGPSMGLILLHDDADREYQYSQDAQQLLDLQESQGWLIISMKNDFSRVF